MLRRHLPLLTLFAAFVLSAPPAGADVIIDSFTGINGPFGPAVLAASGTASTIEITGGDLVLTDVDGETITGTATFSASDINLTVDDATADNYFEIFITDFQGDWTATLTVDGEVSDPQSIIAAIGRYAFLYSEFGAANFAAIDEIVLTLTNASDPGDFIAVDYLNAVPEPGTAGMLMLGLFGLAAATPRKRIAA